MQLTKTKLREIIKEELLNEYSNANLKKELKNAKDRIKKSITRAEFSIEPEEIYTQLGEFNDWLTNVVKRLKNMLR